jgi:hypothetical protein
MRRAKVNQIKVMFNSRASNCKRCYSPGSDGVKGKNGYSNLEERTVEGCVAFRRGTTQPIDIWQGVSIDNQCTDLFSTGISIGETQSETREQVSSLM